MDFLIDDDNMAVSGQVMVSPWRVLLVDDEPDLHSVTRLALRGFTFMERPLQLISAHSAAEARQVLAREPDIALALIDVVMETDSAGLELVHHIRQELGNPTIRLVLRTGQPGQAPEDRVIREYEIDDYKSKTELTVQKLHTLLYAALRAYRDLRVIEQQRDGLSAIIQAATRIQSVTSLKEFSSAVLEQLTSLLHLEKSAFYCLLLPRQDSDDRTARTLAATGDFVDMCEGDPFACLPAPVVVRLREAMLCRHSMHYDDTFVMYMQTEDGGENLLYIQHALPLSPLDRQLLEIYARSVAITFDNLSLQQDLHETQRELVYTLADAVEARSKETGAHVRRVSLISELLARLYGLDDKTVTMVRHASPLHDIGKVAIPDAILHKPGPFEPQEWAFMQKHALFGMEMLQRSRRGLMKVAAEIAWTHHERWDGGGYPRGLQGEAIPITGRITALADVFDALGSRRCYKSAWDEQAIREQLLAERGRQFDPALVDLLLANYEQFLDFRHQFPDDDVPHP